MGVLLSEYVNSKKLNFRGGPFPAPSKSVHVPFGSSAFLSNIPHFVDF